MEDQLLTRSYGSLWLAKPDEWNECASLVIHMEDGDTSLEPASCIFGKVTVGLDHLQNVVNGFPDRGKYWTHFVFEIREDAPHVNSCGELLGGTGKPRDLEDFLPDLQRETDDEANRASETDGSG